MLDAPCYIFSDTHLGVGPSGIERELVSFLRHLPGRAGSLIINGDLFEFWFEWRTVIPRPYFRTLAALADLCEAGLDVLMIAGNHDCWGGDVLTRDVGVRYVRGDWTGTLVGWRTRIAHGDGLRAAEDRKYRVLRAVLRHRWSIAAFRLLHPDLGSRLAHGSSDMSRTYRARDSGEGLKQVARRWLQSDSELDLVVFGHSHVATLERVPSGGVYANAGSWLDAPTFLRVTAESIELRRWGGSPEGDLLDTVERHPKEALAKP